jgi:formamidopyrimidine-DNA glycosylase
MPELPEAEAMKAALAPHVLGQTIVSVWADKAWIKSHPSRRTLRLRDRKIIAVRRHGKAIIIDLHNNTSLIVRLGMSGRLVARQQRKKHDLLALHLDNADCIVFNDFRRFGSISLESSSESETLRSLGPDALTSSFSAASLPPISSRSIKSVLLDQRIVAGLGNIYSCESLFKARIDPRRRLSSITLKERLNLIRSIKSVLRLAISRGGSTLDDYRNTEGEAGDYDRLFAVFGQEGKRCPKCRCSTGVTRIREGGRSTYFCPVYQK